jgi:P27 family predicted phage terminase small subunit
VVTVLAVLRVRSRFASQTRERCPGSYRHSGNSAVKRTPPDHLSDEMKSAWRSWVRRYRFQGHHLRLLTLACEAWDRGAQARTQLETDGLTTTNRHGELRPHPAAAIERDSAIRFARLIRELALSDDDAPNDIRPPRLHGRYTGRA